MEKLLAKEKINREAMYLVLKPLWFTREPVNFVLMLGDLFLVKFGMVAYRERIFRLAPWLFDQCIF